MVDVAGAQVLEPSRVRNFDHELLSFFVVSSLGLNCLRLLAAVISFRLSKEAPDPLALQVGFLLFISAESVNCRQEHRVGVSKLSGQAQVLARPRNVRELIDPVCINWVEQALILNVADSCPHFFLAFTLGHQVKPRVVEYFLMTIKLTVNLGKSGTPFRVKQSVCKRLGVELVTLSFSLKVFSRTHHSLLIIKSHLRPPTRF